MKDVPHYNYSSKTGPSKEQLIPVRLRLITIIKQTKPGLRIRGTTATGIINR